MQCAPIALFVYKRLRHVQKTIDSLKKNNLAAQSELYIYADGPKDAQSQGEVEAVREWIKSVEGFKQLHIIERNENFGLAKSIIQGVSELVERFGKVIVIEDDLFLSPYFLRYMNEGLALYEHEEKVASIHGYALPIKESLPETYFLRGADCWGWATWKRAWSKFEADGKKLLSALEMQNLLDEFDFQGTQSYVQMLKNQIAGKNNSWAIRWHASAFLHDMLTLYPGRSLVFNTGLDDSGEHCGSTSMLDVQLSNQPIEIKQIAIEKSQQAFKAYVKFFKAAKEPFYRKVVRKAKALFSV